MRNFRKKNRIDTLGNMEITLLWSKSAGGYRWEQCSIQVPPKEDFFHQKTPKGPFLTENDSSQNLILWELKDAILFAHFANIESSAESFLKWANEHGRLINVESTGNDCRVKSNSLDFWMMEHKDLSFAVMLWEMWSNNDTRLDGFFEWTVEDKIYVHHINPARLSEIDFEQFKTDQTYRAAYSIEKTLLYNAQNPKSAWIPRFCENSAKNAAFIYIQLQICLKLNAYRVRLDIYPPNCGELQERLEASSLLSAMWYQLHLALSGNMQLRRCSLCGKWENMAWHRSTWTRHANCANIIRVRHTRCNKKNEEAKKAKKGFGEQLDRKNI